MASCGWFGSCTGIGSSEAAGSIPALKGVGCNGSITAMRKWFSARGSWSVDENKSLLAKLLETLIKASWFPWYPLVSLSAVACCSLPSLQPAFFLEPFSPPKKLAV